MSGGHPIPRRGPAAARGRRRRRRTGEEIKHNPDRWMASYMDVVTVLMCMFIVLYAMSTVDDEKYAALRASLAEGFGTSAESLEATGVLETDNLEDRDLGSTTQGEQQDELLPYAEAELEDLMRLKREIRHSLREAGHEDSVTFVIDQRGLTVRMVGAETFFNSNLAHLRREGVEVLEAIAPVLAPTPRSFEIGGHADYRDPGYPYATNWELSSARATTVLRELVEEGGITSSRIVAVGYGHEHPLSEDSLQTNRRVDVTVLSEEPEQVRELMEQLRLGDLETSGGAAAAERYGSGGAN